MTPKRSTLFAALQGIFTAASNTRQLQIPQGLKPASLAVPIGTAEAVPFHNLLIPGHLPLVSQFAFSHEFSWPTGQESTIQGCKDIKPNRHGSDEGKHAPPLQRCANVTVKKAISTANALKTIGLFIASNQRLGRSGVNGTGIETPVCKGRASAPPARS
jgi:hypothetical protein